MTIALKFGSYSLPWRDLPGLLPENAEVFAIGDVHGQADLLERVLEDIRNTPRNGAVRHLVFVGDLIDRGPSSVGAVDLAMRGTALANADVLHVLPGNHDLALHFGLLFPDLLSLWISGGGKTVLSELGMSEEDNTPSEIQGELRKVMHPEYLQLMAEGPTYLQLGDLLFVHAGVHPYGDVPEFLGQDRFFVREEYHWATIRYPFLSHRDGWDLRDPDPERRDRKPTVIVHGHTPALRRDIASDADLEFCDGVEIHRSIALDIGAAYRAQLAYTRIRSRGDKTEMRIHAVKGELPEKLL
ncbi:metallophosphoesterase [Sulfitobacter guttiformis]|uniref:Serine/threonine protein phosphatase 1 n=1 Tax=Sulfitobacter guttiformis TaxID=74349 RepID=A0A420DMQ4_9RHOB|nr:metallophosphoesterase [Sulfitobacter guttiformis]KIN72875.1 Ser/Thr protein phosphatase family protein [Sulfitobacter guttiformis KCTC 32187]RKE95564.1 serine/threonine protein phosphatase 1 [Sulfitobacter guttiformis]